MPYSRNLYENMPLYARLFDARTGEILRHLCEAIQVEFDVIHRLIEEYEYFLFLPSTLNEGFLDFLQQYVGLGYEGGDRWIGVAIKPDWPTWRKKAAIAAAWQYWRSKGTEWGVRKAYEIWCEWDEAFSEERLELRMPFGETNTATPPQWWGWGTRYDAHLTQLYAERQHLGGAYKPGFEYQPPGVLLEYPRWRWDYAEPWSPRILDAFTPTKKINSQHGMGPREVWEHFRPDLDDLDFFEWNEIFDRVRELHAECWPAPYLPRIWTWLDRPPQIDVNIRQTPILPEYEDRVETEYDLNGMQWGNWWRFPIAPPDHLRYRFEERERYLFFAGWRWGDNWFPGTAVQIQRDDPRPEDLIPEEFQVWYGATWGDIQDTRAVFKEVGSWIPVSKSGSQAGWGELWDTVLWAHPGSVELRWIVAVHRYGPFKQIVGEPWYSEPEQISVEVTEREIRSGFNAIAWVWGHRKSSAPTDGGSETPADTEPALGLPDPDWRWVEIVESYNGNWQQALAWGVLTAEKNVQTYEITYREEGFWIPGWRWGDDRFPGTGWRKVKIEPDPSSLPPAYGSWPGTTWGDTQQTAARLEPVIREIPVTVPGTHRNWGEGWSYAPWPMPSRTENRSVRADRRVGPFEVLPGAMWCSMPERIVSTISITPVASGFNREAQTWGDRPVETPSANRPLLGFPDPSWEWEPFLEPTPGNLADAIRWGISSASSTKTAVESPPQQEEIPYRWGSRAWGDTRLGAIVRPEPEIKIARAGGEFQFWPGVAWGTPYSAREPDRRVSVERSVESGLDVPHRRWGDPSPESWYWSADGGLQRVGSREVTGERLFASPAWRVGRTEYPPETTVEMNWVGRSPGSVWSASGVSQREIPAIAPPETPRGEPTADIEWGVALNGKNFEVEDPDILVSNAALAMRWTDRSADQWLAWAFSGAERTTVDIPGNWGGSFEYGVPWLALPDETAASDEWQGVPSRYEIVPDNFGDRSRWGESWGSEWSRNSRRAYSSSVSPGRVSRDRSSRLWLYPAHRQTVVDDGRRGSWNEGNWWTAPEGISTRRRFEIRHDLIGAGATDLPDLPWEAIATYEINASTVTPPNGLTVRESPTFKVGGLRQYYWSPGDRVTGGIWVKRPIVEPETGAIIVPERRADEVPPFEPDAEARWNAGGSWYWATPQGERVEIEREAKRETIAPGVPWQRNYRESTGAELEPVWTVEKQVTAGELWYAKEAEKIPVVNPLTKPVWKVPEPQLAGQWSGAIFPEPPADDLPVGTIVSNATFSQKWTTPGDGWLMWALTGATTAEVRVPDNWGRCLEYGIPWINTAKETSPQGWSSSPRETIVRDNRSVAWAWEEPWHGREWYRNRKKIAPSASDERSGEMVRASLPWFTSERSQTIRDDGIRHTWNGGNWWTAPKGIEIVEEIALPELNGWRQFYFPPGSEVTDSGWIPDSIDIEFERVESGSELPIAPVRPTLAEFIPHLGKWNDGGAWYWESPFGVERIETTTTTSDLAFPGIPWQRNFSSRIPYDPDDYPPYAVPYRTPGVDWFAYREWMESVRVQLIPESETWEIGGTDHGLIVGWEIHVIPAKIRGDTMVLKRLTTPERTVVRTPAFVGTIPGFEWGNRYATLTSGYFLFEIAAPEGRTVGGGKTFEVESVPEISLNVNLSNLVADWALFGRSGEKIIWNYHNWQTPGKPQVVEVIPEATRFVTAQPEFQAKYGDWIWPLVGLWGVRLPGSQAEDTVIRTPIVETMYFPNIFGFWSNRTVSRWEEITIVIWDDYPPLQVYPLLQAIASATSWMLAVEIDAQVKLVFPTTYFWSAADNPDDRSPFYSEDRQILTLEFVFEPDVEEVGDWGFQKLRGTSLFLENRLFDYRFYDWYGRLTGHLGQAFGVRYKIAVSTAIGDTAIAVDTADGG